LFIQITTRPWLGILITATIFSALHGQFLGFVPRLILGIVLGALYWFSGSIYPGIIAHFLNNAVQVVLIYVSPQFLETEPNFAAGIIAGSTFIVCALTWWMIKVSQTSYTEVYDTEDDFHIGPRDEYIA
jgi:membrane protease YdiL (CAAX protease family)